MENKLSSRMWKYGLLALVLVWSPASPVLATQKQGPLEPQSLLGLGIVAGDPEGWGITAKIWLDHEMALQPVLKLGWNGNLALQFDFLWHNYNVIPSDLDSWPVYIGLGGVVDSSGPSEGIRGILGLDYIFRNLPGDFYVQLVPTYWLSGMATMVQLYGEVGFRFYL
jgi:hypothetical protein